MAGKKKSVLEDQKVQKRNVGKTYVMRSGLMNQEPALIVCHEADNQSAGHAWIKDHGECDVEYHVYRKVGGSLVKRSVTKYFVEPGA